MKDTRTAPGPLCAAVTPVGAAARAMPTVRSANRACSTFHRVSMPSLTFWPAARAPVWATVTDPSAFGVMVYDDRGRRRRRCRRPRPPARPTRVTTSADDHQLAQLHLAGEDRRLQRGPGERRRCWCGGTAAPAGRCCRSRWPGRPGRCAPRCGCAAHRSPSTTSSAPRPVMLSPPGPPSRMLPAPQTGPVTGQYRPPRRPPPARGRWSAGAGAGPARRSGRPRPGRGRRSR